MTVDAQVSAHQVRGCDLTCLVSDPLLRTSISEITVSMSYEWLWLVLGSVTMALMTFTVSRLQQDNGRKNAVAGVHACLVVFVNSNNSFKQTILQWRTNMSDQSIGGGIKGPSWWRLILYYLLHLPFLLLASIPAAGFVIMPPLSPADKSKLA